MELSRAEVRMLWLGSANPAKRDRRIFRKYFKTEHWVGLRDAKLRRDPWCQLCRRVPASQVHHSNYACFFKERLDRDIISVCGRCHQRISRY